MRTYIAASGHQMLVTTTHTDREGRQVPDYWNAAHATTCPCLTSEDW